MHMYTFWCFGTKNYWLRVQIIADQSPADSGTEVVIRLSLRNTQKIGHSNGDLLPEMLM